MRARNRPKQFHALRRYVKTAYNLYLVLQGIASPYMQHAIRHSIADIRFDCAVCSSEAIHFAAGQAQAYHTGQDEWSPSAGQDNLAFRAACQWQDHSSESLGWSASALWTQGIFHTAVPLTQGSQPPFLAGLT